LRSPLNRGLQSLRDTGADAGIAADVTEIDIAGSCEQGLWMAAPVEDRNAENARTSGTLLKRKVGEFFYSLTASVFFQANDYIITDLVRLVRELAGDTTPNAAADLFAGVGLFSLPLASRFKAVVAVESSPAASRLCRENASTASTGSLRTVCSDVECWLESESGGYRRGFDLILLNPPRSGAGTGVMEKIRALAPETILYVACDPHTLCRDLSRVSPGEYRIERIEGLDMFPQTYHFETVVRLVRR